jgi:Domain of unknown function (DUF1877)
MGQSATLYRISEDTFAQLEKSDTKHQFDIYSTSKSYSGFQGSFVALEYILSKGQDTKTAQIVSEIFNPSQKLGVKDFESLTSEEQMEFYENGGFIYYLDKSIVSCINQFLETVPESDIHKKYDAKELNDNAVYPGYWHNDNSPDQAFNLRHILEDILELKKIFKQASQDNNYILVYVG